DPAVKTGSAGNDDYAGSGYDRGHLAPAADMGWSVASMHDCFYYSNISPQEPSFNRGVWKRAETLVRNWAVEYQDIYIVTGPVLNQGLPTIGANKVSVPTYYYKVILNYQNSLGKGIGFIIPNCSSSEPLQSFAVSIDNVEKFTGINFFPLLPDEQEKNIESNLNINAWIWKNTSTNSQNSQSTISKQCKGKTKAGNRCKKRTTSSSGYCNIHQ
ncbi:MAG: DNA/RNA non-specific endonuclease, partial [Paludibacter sp.]|nr:DNA/RNA non-specific endonuclease [Paludibacter sp.]